MSVKRAIITIGFDKDGNVDFGISTEISELPIKRMNELRAMVPVAIGVAEDMWKRHSHALNGAGAEIGTNRAHADRDIIKNTLKNQRFTEHK